MVSHNHILTNFLLVTMTMSHGPCVFTSHAADDNLMTESEPDNSPPLGSDSRSQGASGQLCGLTPVAPAPGWSPVAACSDSTQITWYQPQPPGHPARTLTSLMVTIIPWARPELILEAIRFPEWVQNAASMDAIKSVFSSSYQNYLSNFVGLSDIKLSVYVWIAG